MNFVNATVDIRSTGLTAVDLRTVARRALETWNQRQATYLKGEIDRLRLTVDAQATAQREAYERELAGLADSMEDTLSQIDPGALPVGVALSYLGTMIREQAYKDGRYTAAEQEALDGFGILDMPQILYAYKPRPLAGLWATAPFLHNGSVPTISDLLSPANERPATFQTGSHDFETRGSSVSRQRQATGRSTPRSPATRMPGTNSRMAMWMRCGPVTATSVHG